MSHMYIYDLLITSKSPTHSVAIVDTNRIQNGATKNNSLHSNPVLRSSFGNAAKPDPDVWGFLGSK